MAEDTKADTTNTEANAPSGVDITPDGDGGVLKEILREGEGDQRPQRGNKVFVHYVGTLTDGTKFDSSRDRNEKFTFDLGKGSVIRAWDIGVATMRRGEIAKFTCRHDYAYGERGSPPKIPANATLIFEVELFDWKGEDLSKAQDEGILRTILEDGKGYQTPNEGATVKVHLCGSYDGRVFEDREVKFVVGEGNEEQVISGIDHAIKRFKQGEKSRLEIAAKYAFGRDGHKEYNIPSDAKVNYDVLLIEFEKAKEAWEMEPEEKLEQSEIVKQKGTNYFKAGNFKRAKAYYQKIVDYLKDEEPGNEGEEMSEKRKALLLAAYLNIAMVYLKLNDNLAAKKECDNALGLDKNNVKGLFRRGQAYANMKEYTQAIQDFQAVLSNDPENKAAKNQLIIANQRLKEDKAKEKKLYAGMFQKFAEEDLKHDKDYRARHGGSGPEIGVWDNKMAEGMMTIEQELEAFGETMPERKDYSKGNEDNTD